jgi:hypothetical protein
MTIRTKRGRIAAAATLALVVAVLTGTAGVRAYSNAAEFHPQRFKAAAARGDLETMEDEAYAAADRQALVGLSEGRVRELLGNPSRVTRGRHEYEWDLGMVNDTMGPGDDGWFVVQFDSSWGRVIAARVQW